MDGLTEELFMSVKKEPDFSKYRFKVGDLVKVKRKVSPHFGLIGVVDKVVSSNPVFYHIRFGRHSFKMSTGHLEKIEMAERTSAESL